MRGFIKPIMLILLALIVTTELDAQRKKKRRRPVETRVRGEEGTEAPNIMDDLNFEIKFGNLVLGEDFTISLKPSVGYKFHRILSAGVGGRMYYVLDAIANQPDQSYINYGAFMYGRVKLGESFYIQTEYSYMNYELQSGFILQERKNVLYPLVGIGYQQGLTDWTFGTEILFVASEAGREATSTIEWWLSASYNF